MTRVQLTFSALALCALSYAQHDHTPMQNETDSLSYAVGMSMATSLKGGGVDSLNYTLFVEAVQAIMAADHTSLDGNTANTIVNNYITKLKAAEAAKAAEAGTKFLAENAKKEGVVTLPNGLQYKVIKQGTGPKPVDGQTVKTHYQGMLIDGKIFDSSYSRGEPTSFNINQVIPGWTQALKLMSPGSKWELYIPQNLAYGSRAMGAKIPPYSALIFTIELLEIQP